MSDGDLGHRLNKALNRFVKWRSVLAGWQLGSRALDEGGEVAAVRDHLDATLALQVEIAALRKVLRVDPELCKDAADLEPNNVLEGVRAHRMTTLVLRAEMNALVAVLIKDGTVTMEQVQQAMLDEIALAESDMEHRFPGAKATDFGMRLTPQFQNTVNLYKFPP